MSYCLNLFPVHCKEKLIVIAPFPRTVLSSFPQRKTHQASSYPWLGRPQIWTVFSLNRYNSWLDSIQMYPSTHRSECLSALTKELPLQQLETDRGQIKVHRISGCGLPTSSWYICNTNPIPRPRGSLGRGAGCLLLDIVSQGRGKWTHEISTIWFPKQNRCNDSTSSHDNMDRMSHVVQADRKCVGSQWLWDDAQSQFNPGHMDIHAMLKGLSRL